MEKLSLFILTLLTAATPVLCQVLPANKLQQALNQAKSNAVIPTIPLFTRTDSAAHNRAAFLPNKPPASLRIDTQQLSLLVANQPEVLAFSIPTETGSIELELVQVNLFSEGSKLLLGTAAGTVEAPLYGGLFYQGVIKGNEKSLVAVSITDGELSGLIADETGNRVLSRMRTTQNSYLFYRDNTLAIPRNFTCDAREADNVPGKGRSPANQQSINCKVVNIYFEADFNLYTKNGSSVAQTSNYVANLFNQVAVLYNRENIAIRIAGLKIWTVTDPYANLNSTGSMLDAFLANQNSSPPPGITSQLSHLLSGRSLGGGIAYVNVLCAPSYKYGVSADLSATYADFPSYSWEVSVVAHELGHNFGSPHTQSCSWPGGAIDNCYTTEGGCPPGPAPVNGGTIMSYCHLTSNGINFFNGFGPLPGNLLRSRVGSSACIPSASDVPVSLGTKNAQATTIKTYWVSNSGSTQFTIQYRVSGTDTWTTVGPFAGPQYVLTGLQPNTAYNWRVTGECSGSYSTEADFTTGSAIYCTPTYSMNGCTYAIGLKQVVLNGTILSTNSGCAPTYYTYYSGPVATLSKTVANPFAIELLGYQNPQQLAIWIDFNQNYEFDPAERVFGTTTGVQAPVSGSLTIPATVQSGVTYRMRIRNQFNSSVTSPCGPLSYGEAEDYLVYVDSGCPPTPAITLSATAITCQQNTTLTVANCTGTVSWLPGNSTGTSIVVTPTQTTNYTATCSLPGCSTSQQATVNVAPDMVSVQNGNWDNPDVWSCQRVPTASTPLLISAGHTVTLPANYTGSAASLTVAGQLTYQTGGRLTFNLPPVSAPIQK